MKSFSFPGKFEDDDGQEFITWHIQSSDLPGWAGRYEIRTRIRGVGIWGADFDGLEPCEPADIGVEALPLNSTGELSRCTLAGDLPCVVDIAGDRLSTAVRFELDLREHPESSGHSGNLRLSITIGAISHSVNDEWFEEGTLRLDNELRPNRLICCATCLYSDYSPAGHGLMGMACHRSVKDQYLAVTSKADYWSVPITEEVPETYLCDEYDHRIPGTGYRG